jgi:ribosome maturation factor RimP
MSLARRVEQLITPAIADLGFRVVQVLLLGKQRPRLQVMVERTDEAPVSVDDCATVSRTISAVLDVNDPVEGSYTLEVSSPGIDRPLTREEDFDRFAGQVAKLELASGIDGRRRFQGRLAGREGDAVRIEVEGTIVNLPLADIVRAKLVLTDELLAAHKQRD